MTESKFRALALALPQAEEGAHMGHPDFRVNNKVFASLWPAEKKGVIVKVPIADQEALMQMHPKAFSLNGWSHRGALNVHLAHVRGELVRDLLLGSWKQIAPKKLVQAFEAGD